MKRTLYSFTYSPNPAKVRFALTELGADYELTEINLFRGEHRSEAFLRLNPHGKVPVLVEGDLTLRESNAMLVHLGQTIGQSLWPGDGTGHALALQWLFFEAAQLAHPCGVLWWTDRIAPAVGRPGKDEATVAEAVEQLEDSLGVLDAHLGDRTGGILGGDLSLVDCSLAVRLAMLRSTRLDDPARWPNVHAYRERMRARPAWQQARCDAFHDLD